MTKDLIRLTIEVTRRCNLKCKMCLHHGPLYKGQCDHHPLDMDYDFFCDIVDQFASLHPYIKYATPQFQGEALLHPRFRDMCGYLNGKGILVNITTNGMLLSHDLSDYLISLPYFDGICFSLDGATKEMVEKIRVGANYERIMDNISYFLNSYRESGRSRNPISVYVNMVRMPDNECEYEKFIRYWIDRQTASIQICRCTNDDGSVSGLYFELPRIRCYTLDYFSIILTNGDVIPCCRDHQYEMIMGNVHNQSLRDIWGGEEYERLRQVHLKGRWNEMPLCRNCQTWMCDIPHPIDVYRMRMIGDDILVKQGPFWEWFEKVEG